MTLEFRSIGTEIEEEDFCRWTEKDVNFKSCEGLNAKLKKFYSWDKAILVKIEIDGATFCGCLGQIVDNFAPVRFGPPKRPPLPCITPTKPKPPRRKKDAKPSSNAYSRENWPRVYIDPFNTVSQRLRSERDKNLSGHQSNASSRIGKEDSNLPSKKVDVLVDGNRKKSPRCDQKQKNSAQHQPRLLRSARCFDFSELLQSSEIDGSKSKSNDTSSARKRGRPCSKYNKKKGKNASCEGNKKRYELRGTPLSCDKPNLRSGKAKNGIEFVLITSSESEMDETLSSQHPLSDVSASPAEYDRNSQHASDVNDKSIAISESSIHQTAKNPTSNPENAQGDKIFDSDVSSPTWNEDEALKIEKAAEVSGSSKPSKRKKKKRELFEKEYSDLSDVFDKMTLRKAILGHPKMQSSPKKEPDSRAVGGEELFKISQKEMEDPNTATCDSKPTNRSRLLFEEWCFIKED